METSDTIYNRHVWKCNIFYEILCTFIIAVYKASGLVFSLREKKERKTERMEEKKKQGFQAKRYLHKTLF